MVNPFQAQYAPTDLQLASTPLTGAEAAHFVQGGVSTQLTVSQIMAAIPSLVSVPGLQASLLQGLLNIATLNVNFNAANTDTQIPIPLPTGYTTYAMNAVLIARASASLTSATCGLFTQAGGAGSAIVTGGTSVTVSTGAANTLNNLQALTLTGLTSTTSFNISPLFFRVASAQGSPATAEVIVVVRPLF